MAIRSNARLGGSIPQHNRVPEGLGIKPLFHSVRDIALILDKTVDPGYGVLKVGTLMCIAANSGNLVPYPETVVTDDNTGSKSYLVQEPGSAATDLFIKIEDAYKFAVGDSFIIAGASVENLGAITAIDVTAGNGTQAKISVTVAVGTHADFQFVDGAHAYVKSAAATPWAAAAYILDADIDTGEGEFAAGALTSVVVSNAVLYTASLVGYDAAAKADLGTIDDGRLTILK